MWCSIETEQLNLDEVTSAKLDVAKGGSTGTLTLVAERTPQPPYYIYEPDIVVRFSQVRSQLRERTKAHVAMPSL